MLTTRTPGRAGGEHRQQRAPAPRTRRRSRPTSAPRRPAGRSARRRRSGSAPSMPATTTTASAAARSGGDREHPVHAGHADVVHPAAADPAGGQRRGDLGGDRAVGGPGREHQHRRRPGPGSSPTNAHRASSSTTASGQRSRTAAAVGVVHPGGPGERLAAGVAVEQGREAGDRLRRRLAGGVDDLGRAGARAPGRGPGGRSRGRRCACAVTRSSVPHAGLTPWPAAGRGAA